MIIHSPYISGSLESENPIPSASFSETSSYAETFKDAPSDGLTYGRKDGVWIEVQAVATVISLFSQTFIPTNAPIFNFASLDFGTISGITAT